MKCTRRTTDCALQVQSINTLAEYPVRNKRKHEGMNRMISSLLTQLLLFVQCGCVDQDNKAEYWVNTLFWAAFLGEVFHLDLFRLGTRIYSTLDSTVDSTVLYCNLARLHPHRVLWQGSRVHSTVSGHNSNDHQIRPKRCWLALHFHPLATGNY